MNKFGYLIEVFGMKRLCMYAFLRIFRPFLLLKDKMLEIYKEKEFANKIYLRKELNNISVKDKRYSRKIDDFFGKYGKKINRHWHYCYADRNGIFSEKYIPEINYYTEIEPCLNKAKMATGYDDKNIYDILFKDILMPECLLRCMNGEFYNQKYERFLTPDDALSVLEPNKEYIIKPAIDGQGGKGIFKLIRRKDSVYLGNDLFNMDELPENYRQHFVVQPFIEQHQSLNRVYPHSINTIRVISLRLHDKIIILSTIIRFGNRGSFVDNGSSGGVACGIRPNGILKDFAVDTKLRKYRMHPYTKISFGGVEIPGIKEVKELVEYQHTKLPYFDIVSWDIAIHKSGEPVLIEINLMEQAVNFHQATNGPLFGDYTDEILDRVYG